MAQSSAVPHHKQVAKTANIAVIGRNLPKHLVGSSRKYHVRIDQLFDRGLLLVHARPVTEDDARIERHVILVDAHTHRMGSHARRNIAWWAQESGCQLRRRPDIAGNLVRASKRCILGLGNRHEPHIGQFVRGRHTTPKRKRTASIGVKQKLRIPPSQKRTNGSALFGDPGAGARSN